MRIAASLVLTVLALPAAADLPADPGWDPAIRRGVLDNGLTYFVRGHADPPGRFSARLVVKTGSLVEEDGERGLMHLLEHLGFEGSPHFPGGTLARRLEEQGMRFGPHVNASTGYDVVDYRLELPATPEGLRLGLDALHDWAGAASLLDEAIEGERGVVLAELRLRSDAEARLGLLQSRLALEGARQATHDPGGSAEDVATASAGALRSLYRRWWHPGLMAVVIVGDVDAEEVERHVRATFGSIPARPDPPPPIAANGEPIAATIARVVPEPAVEGQRVSLSWPRRQPALLPDAVQQRRSDLVAGAGEYALRARLMARTQSGAIPASRLWAGVQQDFGDVEILRAAAQPLPGRVTEVIETLASEMARLALHGPTPSEAARAIGDVAYGYSRSLERAPSGEIAHRLQDAFVHGDVMRAPAAEIALVTALRDGITAEDLHAWMRVAVGTPRRVALVAGPGELPSEDEALAAFERGLRASPPPLPDVVAPTRLVASAPQARPVVARREVPEIGGTWIEYGNGLRLLVLPTSHAPDEILVAAWAREDLPAMSLPERAASTLAAEMLPWIGAGEVAAEDLPPWLTNHRAKLWTTRGRLGWILQGESTSWVDPLFERLHALFTAPRIAGPSFEGARESAVAGWNAGLADPMTRAEKETENLLLGIDPAWATERAEDLRAVDAASAEAAWRRVAGEASRWTVVVVGATTPEAIAAAGSTWLATLPGAGRGSEPPWPAPPELKPGHHAREVTLAGEAAACVAGCLVRPGGARPDLELSLLADVVSQRLHRRLRDEHGQTYSVDVSLMTETPHPRFAAIGAFADLPPSRRTELSPLAGAELRDLALRGPSAEELELARSQALRSVEEQSRSNDHVLYAAAVAIAAGRLPETPARRAARLRAITRDDLRRVARARFDLSRTFEVAVIPHAP